MAAARSLPERRRASSQVYVHGTAVRRLEPAQNPPRRHQRYQEQERRQKATYRIRRNQEKALQMDLPYLAVLVAAAVCALYICVNYIHIQSGMTGRMDTIKTLEQQLDTLKAENDALETSINTSVDLDHVYKVATEELGMVYAGKDQVLLYNQTESEYVKQDEDIPEQ